MNPVIDPAGGPPLVGLPPGLRHRPLRPGDRDAVVPRQGRPVVLRGPEPDPGAVAIVHDDVVVAVAEVLDAERVDVEVLPAYHGLGIGTALARWLRERARAAGAGVVGMRVAVGSPADRFLADQGYEVQRTGTDDDLVAWVDRTVEL